MRARIRRDDEERHAGSEAIDDGFRGCGDARRRRRIVVEESTAFVIGDDDGEVRPKRAREGVLDDLAYESLAGMRDRLALATKSLLPLSPCAGERAPGAPPM